MRSRTGPPSISYTGMPSARALTSSKAFSMAAMACWITPPDDWRLTAYMCATCASQARGSLPMTAGASLSITADRPGPPKVSLYSLQPTRPVSVVSLRKSKLRVPASQCSDSILAIFIGACPPSPESNGDAGRQQVQRRGKCRVSATPPWSRASLCSRAPPSGTIYGVRSGDPSGGGGLQVVELPTAAGAHRGQVGGEHDEVEAALDRPGGEGRARAVHARLDAVLVRRVADAVAGRQVHRIALVGTGRQAQRERQVGGADVDGGEPRRGAGLVEVGEPPRRLDHAPD